MTDVNTDNKTATENEGACEDCGTCSCGRKHMTYDHEAFYDAEIVPAIQALLALANSKGIPMLVCGIPSQTSEGATIAMSTSKAPADAVPEPMLLANIILSNFDQFVSVRNAILMQELAHQRINEAGGLKAMAAKMGIDVDAITPEDEAHFAALHGNGVAQFPEDQPKPEPHEPTAEPHGNS